MAEGEVTFATKTTLVVGGILTALAVEMAIKLYKQLAAKKEKTAAKEAAAAGSSGPTKATAAKAAAVVTVQYCGCAQRRRLRFFRDVPRSDAIRNSRRRAPPCGRLARLRAAAEGTTAISTRSRTRSSASSATRLR